MAGAGTSSGATAPLVAVKQPRATPEQCSDARLGLRFYHAQYHLAQAKMNKPQKHLAHAKPRSCPWVRQLAGRWKARAESARRAFVAWRGYHYDWPKWLPDKWQRVGACETGYGRRPGNWRHSNSSYEGAFGFAKSSWDAFKYRADPKAGPYPADAWQATPRQQYEVALAIWRAYGFSGWGCRGA